MSARASVRGRFMWPVRAPIPDMTLRVYAEGVKVL
jgi:hypothetical protein